MSEAVLEIGRERRLAGDVVVVWRIGHAISSALLSLVLLIGALSVLLGSSLPLALRAGLLVAWLGVTVALAVVAWLWPGLRYRYESYRVLERGLEIRRGVMWRRLIHVPKSRVQHTDVSRGPIERMFDVATLVVFTAGTEHASVPLGGLETPVALAIRDHLIGGGEDDAV